MTIKSLCEHFLTVLSIFLLALLIGCASSGDIEKQPVFARLTITAAKNLNPAVDGRASPLVLRVYQLSETTRFDNSDFFALYENDKALLANELQSRTELEIRPGETYREQLELQPNTRFIAVLAAYRDLDNAQWKDMLPFVINENQTVSIELNENKVKLFVDKQESEKQQD